MSVSSQNPKYFGGVCGGATQSELVICNEKGAIISTVKGPGTNHHLIGIPKCGEIISEMVNNAKKVAGIPISTKLCALGLSLSGCEQESSNKKMEQEFQQSYPTAAEHYVVCSDTIGSIATASAIGGMVLISGTGSNCLLRNPDGSTKNCGGWGHMLGDEGSAWWISRKALKTVFDDEDNLVKSPYSTEVVWCLIKSHFKVESRLDLLDSCYSNFNKSFFAGLCKLMAKAAEDGDELCRNIFQDAGGILARFVIALLPGVHKDLRSTGEVRIVCVGSVWKSWELLKAGFLKELDNHKIPFELTLLKLTQKMAMGAVYLAADSIHFDLPREYTKNYQVFHHYVQKPSMNGN